MPCLTIMFSTNVMNERTENNRQTNCFLKSFSRKPSSDISFSLSDLSLLAEVSHDVRDLC